MMSVKLVKRKLWADESMVNAVKCVQEGKELGEASRLYNVPVETLRRRVIGTVEIVCRPGLPTILTESEAQCLAVYIADMAEMGFNLTKEDVLHLAFKIADNSGRQHPFVDGLSHYSNLTNRTPQLLSYNQETCANKETIVD